jgi:hypothetical protein
MRASSVRRVIVHSPISNASHSVVLDADLWPDDLRAVGHRSAVRLPRLRQVRCRCASGFSEELIGSFAVSADFSRRNTE